MKIGYFGSPEISAELLKAILETGEHEVSFVVSNPDKAQGRSGKLLPTHVSQVALDHNIPLFRFSSIKQNLAEVLETLGEFQADLYFIFAYGKLLPQELIDLPPRRSVNLHASLLPLLRGASPIQSSLLEGFTETGWTLQYIQLEMDAGDIIDRAVVPIEADENTEELTARLLSPGIELSLGFLRNIDVLEQKATPQDESQATYCSKFRMEMSILDWEKSAEELHNQVRAMNPWPVARTTAGGKSIKIYKTICTAGEGPDETFGEAENQLKESPPGRVVALKSGKRRRLFVRTGAGILEILEVQPENKKRMDVSAFLNGFPVKAGQFLGQA